MRVIGTAGHVDHGKSTLVEALTGTHPDRLKEEREREMTIDLGFAWMSLSLDGSAEGEEIGIVDVPGHRDFIENMLAGIGGIDAALFVVAADEGIMPQTREHLSILDLLRIQGGVVALTKIDLVVESGFGGVDWLDLVEADIRQVLKDTVLEGSPIVQVSGKTGKGIPELRAALSACLADRPPRPDLNRPRLSIDRVFTIAGFGSVVTGTLTDGSLNVGDEVEILPKDLRGRIRGLQTHKQKEQSAVSGSRTAVNISGVSVDKIERGDMVAHPGDYRSTRRFDASLRLLEDASSSLKHNIEVKLYLGASEVMARLRLLGSEELKPGHEGWIQLELTRPVTAVRGNRFILRRPSPGETIGGGSVIDPHPVGRHKRFSEEILTNLKALAQGTPAEIVLSGVQSLGAGTPVQVTERTNLDLDLVIAASQELVSGNAVQVLDSKTPASIAQSEQQPDDEGNIAVIGRDTLLVSNALWGQIASKAIREVETYYENYPLRRGISRQELKSRLSRITKASPQLFNYAMHKLIADGELEESGPFVCRAGHEIQFSESQKREVEELLQRFEETPFAPPSVKECQEDVGEEVVNALIELDRLAAVSPEVVFRQEDYDSMVVEVSQLMDGGKTLTVAQVRDHFSTSRKYALAFMEHLDAIGVTVREGDERRLKNN
ncbi:selenocysteine-specific translation elongation factor [Chloroflexota bacterium]